MDCYYNLYSIQQDGWLSWLYSIPQNGWLLYLYSIQQDGWLSWLYIAVNRMDSCWSRQLQNHIYFHHFYLFIWPSVIQIYCHHKSRNVPAFRRFCKRPLERLSLLPSLRVLLRLVPSHKNILKVQGELFGDVSQALIRREHHPTVFSLDDEDVRVRRVWQEFWIWLTAIYFYPEKI